MGRRTRTADWSLVRGAEVAGTAHAVCRPDGRWFVSVDTWEEAAYPALIDVVAADLRHDLHTVIDAEDAVERRRWERLGFTVARRETLLRIPVDPIRTGLADAALPRGIVLLGADAVDGTALRELDDELRADVPGTAGWVNDPDEFRDQTFDDRSFDPALYLVAVDDTARRFAGLVRIWVGRPLPRLGLIGVTRPYRRRGLARALLRAAFATLHDRGVPEVTAEADDTNLASRTLLTALGAHPTGGTLELHRIG